MRVQIIILALLVVSSLSYSTKSIEKEENVILGELQNLSWNACQGAMAALSYVLFNDFIINVAEKAVQFACSTFVFNSDQWKVLSGSYVGLVLRKLKQKTFEPAYFCEMTLGICQPSIYRYLGIESDVKRILSDKPEIIKDNNYINDLYKEIRRDQENGINRDTILMYHVSDLHASLRYKAGTNSQCGTFVCWTDDSGTPKKTEDVAGKWGDYNCDSNPESIRQLIHTFDVTGEPDFIVWTGDNNDHGIYDDPNVTTNATFHITRIFNEIFPNTVIFPIQGNHESNPMNLQNFEREDPVVDNLAEAWSDWMTPKVKEGFLSKSYYWYDPISHPKSNPKFEQKMEKTKIIALNTQNCYNVNFELIGELNDPGQEFTWLEKTLREMEAAGEIAIIIGHISPGCSDCLSNISSRLRILSDRFQHIIRLNLFGHTHYEEFEVIRAIEDNKPVGTNHITSSFTPRGNRNPSIRSITLDAQTKLPVKIETYTLDLEKANKDDKDAKFVFNIDFQKEYGLEDLSPNSMLTLSEKIRVDELLAVRYRVNKQAHGKGTEEYLKKGCNEKCRRTAACDTAFSDYHQTRECYQLFDMDTDEFLSYLFDFFNGAWVNKN
jgi:sphingomyelin phosphodiesterase